MLWYTLAGLGAPLPGRRHALRLIMKRPSVEKKKKKRGKKKHLFHAEAAESQNRVYRAITSRAEARLGDGQKEVWKKKTN